MQTVFKIVLRMSHKSNAEMLLFIRRVAVKMNLNPFYPSPINPTVAELKTLATDFENALKAWGTVHNRGASRDKLKVDELRFLVEQALRGVSAFCQNKTPDNIEAFCSAGFEVTKPRVPVGLVPRVENLHQHFSNRIPSGAVKMKWNRPSGIGKNGVKSYIVLNGPTENVNDATQIATVTKMSFIDTKAANRASNFYWIIPVGSAGNGVISDVAVGYPIGPVVRA